MTAPARLFIGTATANGLMMSDHVTSLAAALGRLHATGTSTRYHTVDGPSLPIQRDVLVHEFLAGECSHLLLVDGDIAFRPDLPGQLLALDKPLVGAVYPRRSPDLERLREGIASRAFAAARALAYDWEVEAIDGKITVEDGLCRVARLGAGFLLVSRTGLEERIRAVEPRRYLGIDGATEIRAFFRDLDGGASGEDSGFLFCRRWIESGGEVLAYAPARVRRIAEMRFGVPFSAYLKAALRQAEAAKRAGLAAGNRAKAVVP